MQIAIRNSANTAAVNDGYDYRLVGRSAVSTVGDECEEWVCETPAGKTYHILVVSDTQLPITCNCPSFLTSPPPRHMCKHMEALTGILVRKIAPAMLSVLTAPAQPRYRLERAQSVEQANALLAQVSAEGYGLKSCETTIQSGVAFTLIFELEAGR